MASLVPASLRWHIANKRGYLSISCILPSYCSSCDVQRQSFTFPSDIINGRLETKWTAARRDKQWQQQSACLTTFCSHFMKLTCSHALYSFDFHCHRVDSSLNERFPRDPYPINPAFIVPIVFIQPTNITCDDGRKAVRLFCCKTFEHLQT